LLETDSNDGEVDGHVGSHNMQRCAATVDIERRRAAAAAVMESDIDADCRQNWSTYIDTFVSAPRDAVADTVTSQVADTETPTLQQPVLLRRSVSQPLLCFKLAAWRSGSMVCCINKITLRWAWLVLGWVTVFGQVYHIGM